LDVLDIMFGQEGSGGVCNDSCILMEKLLIHACFGKPSTSSQCWYRQHNGVPELQLRYSYSIFTCRRCLPQGRSSASSNQTPALAEN
jgi:hypothetical protein